MSLILVVEDSPRALQRITRALAARPHLLVSQVARVDGDGLAGTGPDGDVAVAWAEVAILFCDYHLPGEIMGDQVVRAASLAGVVRIIGMSSDPGFNQRLSQVGAGRVHLKPVVLGGLESGGFADVLDP